jgi:hypothetical protein
MADYTCSPSCCDDIGDPFDEAPADDVLRRQIVAALAGQRVRVLASGHLGRRAAELLADVVMDVLRAPVPCEHPGWTRYLRCVECGEPMTAQNCGPFVGPT